MLHLTLNSFVFLSTSLLLTLSHRLIFGLLESGAARIAKRKQLPSRDCDKFKQEVHYCFMHSVHVLAGLFVLRDERLLSLMSASMSPLHLISFRESAASSLWNGYPNSHVRNRTFSAEFYYSWICSYWIFLLSHLMSAMANRRIQIGNVLNGKSASKHLINRLHELTRLREAQERDHLLCIHHIATISLVFTSWIMNFHRIGLIIMVLMDVADVFLNFAKVKYAIRLLKTN